MFVSNNNDFLKSVEILKKGHFSVCFFYNFNFGDQSFWGQGKCYNVNIVLMLCT